VISWNSASLRSAVSALLSLKSLYANGRRVLGTFSFHQLRPCSREKALVKSAVTKEVFIALCSAPPRQIQRLWNHCRSIHHGSQNWASPCFICTNKHKLQAVMLSCATIRKELLSTSLLRLKGSSNKGLINEAQFQTQCHAPMPSMHGSPLQASFDLSLSHISVPDRQLPAEAGIFEHDIFYKNVKQ